MQKKETVELLDPKSDVVYVIFFVHEKNNYLVLVK